jgi:cytochrome c peroxidase
MNEPRSVSLLLAGIACALGVLVAQGVVAAPPLGLPAPPVPTDNPQSAAKVALGDKLFHDTRFSSTGQVSSATCHVSLHRRPAQRLRGHQQADHAQRRRW